MLDSKFGADMRIPLEDVQWITVRLTVPEIAIYRPDP